MIIVIMKFKSQTMNSNMNLSCNGKLNNLLMQRENKFYNVEVIAGSTQASKSLPNK